MWCKPAPEAALWSGGEGGGGEGGGGLSWQIHRAFTPEVESPGFHCFESV